MDNFLYKERSSIFLNNNNNPLRNKIFSWQQQLFLIFQFDIWFNMFLSDIYTRTHSKSQLINRMCWIQSRRQYRILQIKMIDNLHYFDELEEAITSLEWKLLGLESRAMSNLIVQRNNTHIIFVLRSDEEMISNMKIDNSIKAKNLTRMFIDKQNITEHFSKYVFGLLNINRYDMLFSDMIITIMWIFSEKTISV